MENCYIISMDAKNPLLKIKGYFPAKHNQWSATKCLTTHAPGGGVSRFVTFVRFHGVSTPNVADFQLSVFCPQMHSWEAGAHSALGRLYTWRQHTAESAQPSHSIQWVTFFITAREHFYLWLSTYPVPDAVLGALCTQTYFNPCIRPMREALSFCYSLFTAVEAETHNMNWTEVTEVTNVGAGRSTNALAPGPLQSTQCCSAST